MVDDIVLRKDRSRRLFDGARRLTLPEITDLVKAGANLSARDSAGRDITAEVLGQIVCREEARGQQGPLSSNAMRCLIRLSQSDLKRLLPLHLNHLAAMLAALPARAEAPLGADVANDNGGATLEDEIAAQVEWTYAKRLLARV